MSCDTQNFTTQIISQTVNSITIRINTAKLIPCSSIRVAKYNSSNELLQDFTTVDQLVSVPQDITVELDDDVCKIRVKIVKCCGDCDPSLVTCKPNEVVDPSSCLCVPQELCAIFDRCEPTPCLWGPTIKGYAYYVHTNRTINIPDIGEYFPAVYGGHVCDETTFMPTIRLSDGSIIQANKTISVNNDQGIQSPTPVPGFVPSSVRDRSDTFEFTIPNTTLLKDSKLFLECMYDSCHYGKIIVALVAYCEELENYKLIYYGSLSPGAINEVDTLSIPCEIATSYGQCDPPPPVPSPTADYVCSYISNDYINDCSEGGTPQDPYIKPSDRIIIQPFNEINIPRKFNLNISQDGCNVVAKFCAVGCADPIPPSPSPSPTPTQTPTPSVTPTQTPTPSITPSPCASPSVTPSNTPTRTPTRTPTPTPSSSHIPGCQESFTPNIDISQLKLISTNNSIPPNQTVVENMCYSCSNPPAPQWVSLLDGNIKGYAYYSHEQYPTTYKNCSIVTHAGAQNMPIPNIGSKIAPCWGDHICNRTVFRPKLILGDGSIINTVSGKYVNLNNTAACEISDVGPAPVLVPGFPSVPLYKTFDRSDTFEFNLSPSDLLKLDFSEFYLECALPECHDGVTAVALVGYIPSLNQHRLLFWSCVSAGLPGAKGLFTISDGNPIPCNPRYLTENLGVSVFNKALSPSQIEKQFIFDSRYTEFELYVDKSPRLTHVILPDRSLYELDSTLPNLIGTFSSANNLRNSLANTRFGYCSPPFSSLNITLSAVNLIWYVGSYLSPIKGPVNKAYAVIYDI